MVGFKTVWILLFLLVLGACVPQTKQTECKSNEAFNASLRTCVPVIGGPESFITIESFIPTAPLAKYKNDSTQITFSVAIANPYAQTYSVQWQRIYNGVPVGITPDTPTSYSFAPNLLASQVGTHIIAVTVMVGGKIVDSHNFEVNINDNPQPIIKSSTVSPPRPFGTTGPTYTPYTTNQTFKFEVLNNGAAMTATSHSTDWFLYKAGILIHQSNTTFPTVSPVGSSSPTGSNFPQYVFSPTSRGLGTYLLLAQVKTDQGDVVDEERWNINVTHPPFDTVIARPIYSKDSISTGTVAHTANSIAFNGIPYSQSPLNNFVPIGGTGAQGDYCVQVTTGEGRYAPNTHYVRVDFYLDSHSLVYSATATPSDTEVCLSDASSAVKAGIVFNNASSNSQQSHNIVARVYDIETAQEYPGHIEDSSGLGYPFTWNFTVKPVNLPPTVNFTADSNLSNINCGTASGSHRPCAVVQGATFTVGAHVTDDFYDTASALAAQQGHFSYSMTLLRGTTPISSCTKSFAQTGPAYTGPNYLCSFSIPTFDANGSIDPAADNWSVSMLFSDNGSDVIGSSGATAVPYTYNLTVEEFSDPAGPTMLPQGILQSASSYFTVDWTTPGAHTSAPDSNTSIGDSASPDFVTEGDKIRFNIRVSDPEMDDYHIAIFQCTDNSLACTTTAPIVPLTRVDKTNNAATKITSYPFDIPENMVPLNTPLNALVPRFFKIEVTDAPDYKPGVKTVGYMHLNIKNKNPPPVLDTTPQIPVTTGPYDVVAGYPFSINPGNVSDDSVNSLERNLKYQWYVSPDATTFTAIGGATSKVLTWTPSQAYPSPTAYLKMCITDGTTNYPLSGDFASICTGARFSNTFTINIKKTLTAADTTGMSGNTDPSAGAIWYDSSAGNSNVAYLATVDTQGGDHYINVSKLVRELTGPSVYQWNNTFVNVRFKALKGAPAVAPSDLSITGNANSLYVAYKCANTSAPADAKACVRRIEKDYTALTNGKFSLIHPGKLGFSYTGGTVAVSSTMIDYTPPMTEDLPHDVKVNSVATAGDTVTVNGVIFTGDAGGGLAATEFCTSTTAGCTIFDTATRLVELVNTSTAAALQGVSAQVVGGDTVRIHGMKPNDHYDSTNLVLGVGKISLSSAVGGAWQVPIIDSSRTAADTNKISVLSGAVDTHLGTSTVTVTPLATHPASSFATSIDDNNRLVIALVSTHSSYAGQGRLYNVPLTGSVYGGVVTELVPSLFGGESVANLKVAGSKGANNYTFVVGYGNTSGKWKIGRHNEVGLALNNAVDVLEDLTPHIGTGAHDVVSSGVRDIQVLTDPEINGEVRLAISSHGGTSGVTDGYHFLRWTATNVLKCPSDDFVGACKPFNVAATDANSRVYLSDVQMNLTLGDAGYSGVSENVTNVVHALIFPGAGTKRPSHLMMNIVPESIQGDDTALANGTSGWMLPYVK